jgi:riboflavin synthase
MFTGITEEIGKINRAGPDGLAISAGRVLEGMALGDSIAVNGVCLTITGFDKGSFAAGLMPETLRRTNLGRLRAGDGVNLERALALGDRLGGHLVQGHIDDVGRVTSTVGEGGETVLGIEAPAGVMRYIVTKGFIAVDGVSLTVALREAASFRVALVDYTRKNTTLGERRAGDLVNLEVDIIAKYVEQLSQAQRPGVSVDFLKEHGFLVG